MAIKYRIEEIFIHEFNQTSYLTVGGWAFSVGHFLDNKLFINGQMIPCQWTVYNRYDICRKFDLPDYQYDIGFRLVCEVPGKIRNVKVTVSDGNETKTLLNKSHAQLKSRISNKSVVYSIDELSLNDERNEGFIKGWAYSLEPEQKIEYHILNEKNIKVPCDIEEMNRDDLFLLQMVDKEHIKCGFAIHFPYSEHSSYRLLIDDGKLPVSFNYSKELDYMEHDHFKLSKIKTAYNYMRVFGLKEMLQKRKDIEEIDVKYHNWFLRHKIKQKELDQQKTVTFSYSPKFSILVPTFNTPENLLIEMIESVRNQSYSNWELCIADGSDESNPARALIRKYAAEDSRIRVDYLDGNYGISGNTNRALDLATGEYIGLFDHDDLLEPDLLFEVVKRLQTEKIDVFYTDEDKLNQATGRFEDPNFKPDFAIDQLRSSNYITHFFVVKTGIIKGVGGFRSDYDGSQDYDIIFRCVEKANKVCHIPKILYHWRIHPGSTAGNPENKLYCYEAGRRAIQSHLERSGLKASVEMMPNGWWGLYHTRYETFGDPGISIIIPTYNNGVKLQNCLESLEHVNTYRNYQVVIVDCGSDDLTTCKYLDKLALSEKYRVIHIKTDSISDAYQEGVKHADHDYLLFMNDEMTVLSPDAISEQLGMCMRDDVGVVGAKVLLENDTVYRAGVVFGLANQSARAVLSYIPDDSPGYQMRAIVPSNFSAVSVMGMCTKKSLFEELGGFEQNFPSYWYDVDYCLKVRQKSKLVVLNTFAKYYIHPDEVTHSEEKIRHIKEIEKETELFKEKWKEVIAKGDPYYNQNLYGKDSAL